MVGEAASGLWNHGGRPSHQEACRPSPLLNPCPFSSEAAAEAARENLRRGSPAGPAEGSGDDLELPSACR